MNIKSISLIFFRSYDLSFARRCTIACLISCHILILEVVTLQDGCASFVEKTAQQPCDKLMRLSSNRCFWGEPIAYSGCGRPRKHGDKFKLNEPQTWHLEDEIEFIEHPRLGLLKIQGWHKLHFRQAVGQKLSLIRVEQLEKPKSKPLWLAWCGGKMPS